MNDALERQVSILSALIQVQKKARNAESIAELAFVMVNDTRLLVEYRQAALWSENGGVIAVSGLPEIDRNSPYIHWMTRLFRELRNKPEIKILQSSDMPQSISEEWAAWLPQDVLCIPLLKKNQMSSCTEILLLARETSWQEQEIAILEEAMEMYDHAWGAFRDNRLWHHKVWHSIKRRPVQLIIIAIIMAVLVMPVRLSVLAPAEIAPYEPVLVRVPLNGVIDKFHVRPNSLVEKGQLLFELDSTNFDNQLTIAKKSLQVAEAEYRRTAQRAVFDENSKMELAVRKGHLEEKAAEVKYYSDLLERVKINAPEAGITVFTDVHDWLGRAVAVGEKVFSIANPENVEIDIHLPMADAISFQEGASIRLFLNIAPNQPLKGEVFFISYRAEPTDEGILSYRVKGQLLDGEEIPRIGLSGTAKIYGEKASLFYYLFRRPMATLRQLLGI